MDSEAPQPFRERVASWLLRLQFFLYCTLVLGLLLIGFIWQRMFLIVPAGSVGVIYRPLNGGTDTQRKFTEGLHIIAPWDNLAVYDMRLQQQTLEFKVLSDEGLSLGVQVAVRFQPNEEMVGHLHKDIGTNYFELLIKPEIESHVRKLFGNRPAHELYSTVREVLQELSQISVPGRLEKTDKGLISRPYVQLRETKLTIVELPKIVENAILEKYQQEQLMLAYKFKLEREQKEADRKRTEAAGLRDFAQIAGKSVDLIRWRSLEVASEFAKSPSSKFVVLGGGQGALPMILNLGESSPPKSQNRTRHSHRQQRFQTRDGPQRPLPAQSRNPRPVRGWTQRMRNGRTQHPKLRKSDRRSRPPAQERSRRPLLLSCVRSPLPKSP